MNERCKRTAKRVITAALKHGRIAIPYGREPDPDDKMRALQDLLTDVRHAADFLGLDYEALEKSAIAHYNYEKAVPED